MFYFTKFQPIYSVFAFNHSLHQAQIFSRHSRQLHNWRLQRTVKSNKTDHCTTCTYRVAQNSEAATLFGCSPLWNTRNNLLDSWHTSAPPCTFRLGLDTSLQWTQNVPVRVSTLFSPDSRRHSDQLDHWRTSLTCETADYPPVRTCRGKTLQAEQESARRPSASGK